MSERGYEEMLSGYARRREFRRKLIIVVLCLGALAGLILIAGAATSSEGAPAHQTEFYAGITLIGIWFARLAIAMSEQR